MYGQTADRAKSGFAMEGFVMLRKFFIHAVIGLALGFLHASSGLAQEAQYFHSQIENELSGVDRSAGELLDALVSRPKDVRDAALTAAEHPDMIIRLKYLDRTSPDALGVVLKDYPASVAEAGRILASHGDVIEMMAKNVAGTRCWGACMPNSARSLSSWPIGSARSEPSSARKPPRHGVNGSVPVPRQ